MAFSGAFVKPFRPAFDAGLAAAAGNGLLNNLIAYWPLNEASGDALDAHTNALHLTDTGSVSSDTGKVYTLARQFDGNAAKTLARAGDDALLSTGNVDFTLAVWIKFTALGAVAQHIAGKDDEVNREYRINWLASTNRISFRVFNGSSQIGIAVSSIGAPSTGVWYLIVAYHDSTTNQVGVQINGGTVDTGAVSGTVADTVTPFSIGRCSTTVNSPSNALIGPVSFWKSAAGGGGVLTAAQRTALYNGGAGLAYSAFTT